MLNGQTSHPDNEETYRLNLHQQAVHDWHQVDHGLSWSLLESPDTLQTPDEPLLPELPSRMSPWPRGLEATTQLALPPLDSVMPQSDMLSGSGSYATSSMSGRILEAFVCLIHDCHLSYS